MGLPRFFCDALQDDLLRLTGAEARHAARARRLAVGERVCVFDGSGGEAVGVVVGITRDGVEIRLEERRVPAVPGGPRVTIATAIPKGPRADWMVEKLAELGVAAVWPLESRRSVVTPGGGRIEKWRRAAREANKQSGRSDLMTIEEPQWIVAVVARFGEFGRLWLADREGGGVERATRQAAGDVAGEVVDGGTGQAAAELVLIGPEGGFDEPERVAIRQAGARGLRLGPHVLRIETAAVAAAAVLLG